MSQKKASIEEGIVSRNSPAYRSVSLPNSMLPHDVEDTHANGVPIASSSREARQAESCKQTTQGVFSTPCLM